MENIVEIVEFVEVLDNWGAEDRTSDTYRIEVILNDKDHWSDDMRFIGDDHNVYFIDNMIGKEFLINGKVMKITE